MNTPSIDALDLIVLEYVTLFPAVLAIAWSVLGLVEVARREWRLPTDAGWLPTVAVVMPAHNEELVIGAAIEALLAQNHPAMELHVVCDGCTDATAAIASSYRDRGVVVHELITNVGKSAALQYVLDRVDTDLFLVVDADTTCRPGAIRSMVQQFVDPGVGAVTGHARVANVTNLLTAIQAMEYAVIVGMAKRAEQFWGGLYTVSGAAACLRTSALRAVGGWTVATATEDIEVSWRLQRAGWRLRYEPRAVFDVQCPDRLRPLWRQRRRWARGMVEVMVLHARFATSSNLALIPIGAQVVGAALWMMLATGMVLRAGVELITGSAPQDLLGGAPAAAVSWAPVLLWTLGLFGVQTVIATVLDGAHAEGGWRTVPLFVLFPIYFWVVSYPSFLAGAWQAVSSSRSQVWERTDRVSAPLPQPTSVAGSGASPARPQPPR